MASSHVKYKNKTDTETPKKKNKDREHPSIREFSTKSDDKIHSNLRCLATLGVWL